MQYISDETLLDLLHFVTERTELAINRTKEITSHKDFFCSPEGMDLFDATCMRLQTIGETMKKIDALTGGKLLIHYPEIFWKGVFGLRNIISHEYLSLDPIEIFTVVKNDLEPLLLTLRQMVIAIKQGGHKDIHPST